MVTDARTGALSYVGLIDARTATPEFSTGDVCAIVCALRDLAQAAPLRPTAVVVESDVAYGVLRILEMLVEELCVMRPFRDMPAAKAWLETVRTPGA